ncbi:hypothetical protein C8R43DRAFT_997440 [Mycena crocata]|nr:hypothetical protein C8R43DRAFT_997440 [Mycena crocata]
MILEDGTGDDDTMPVAVKMAVPKEIVDGGTNDDDKEMIRHEGQVYQFLQARLGPSSISPHCYGVLEDRIGSVILILDHGGTALKTFGEAETFESDRLFAKAVDIHMMGKVCHNDLVPRNIVQDATGELRIIDFHIAEMNHACPGKESCKELVNFRQALELGPL